MFRLPDGDLLGIALVDAQIPHEATVLPGPWKEARRDDASFDRYQIDSDEGDPHPGIDNDAFIKDAIKDVY